MTTERDGRQPAELVPGEGFKSHDSHGFNNPRSKPVEFHGSVTARQIAGMGHANSATPINDGGQIVGAQHPFAKPPLPNLKSGRGAPTNPGTPRDANGQGVDHDLGRKVLSEAVKSGGR